MAKFHIVPKDNIEFPIEAKDADDAIISFATAMDSDMNLYFQALSDEDYEKYKETHSCVKATERLIN